MNAFHLSRRKNVQRFSKFCLRQSDEQTNRYKTRNVANTTNDDGMVHGRRDERKKIAENLHLVLSGPNIKRSFLTSCVF